MMYNNQVSNKDKGEEEAKEKEKEEEEDEEKEEEEEKEREEEGDGEKDSQHQRDEQGKEGGPTETTRTKKHKKACMHVRDTQHARRHTSKAKQRTPRNIRIQILPPERRR